MVVAELPDEANETKTELQFSIRVENPCFTNNELVYADSVGTEVTQVMAGWSKATLKLSELLVDKTTFDGDVNCGPMQFSLFSDDDAATDTKDGPTLLFDSETQYLTIDGTAMDANVQPY